MQPFLGRPYCTSERASLGRGELRNHLDPVYDERGVYFFLRVLPNAVGVLYRCYRGKTNK